MVNYRITKYNPAFRDEYDVYKKKEWTSFSEIGKVFNGIKFTQEEYLETEAKYIDVVLLIMESCGITDLRVKSLEKHIEVLNFDEKNILHPKEMREIYSNVKEGVQVDNTALKHIMALILREKLWCKLESNKFYIHFGYDYYMYLGCDLGIELMQKIIKDQSIFIEVKKSPYL